MLQVARTNIDNFWQKDASRQFFLRERGGGTVYTDITQTNAGIFRFVPRRIFSYRECVAPRFTFCA